jgi:hypothetical protein
LGKSVRSLGHPIEPVCPVSDSGQHHGQRKLRSTHVCQGMLRRERRRTSWALRTRIDPRRYDGTELRLRSRSGAAPGAGVPGPAHEIIRCHVLLEQREAPTAVARGILDLATDLRRRFPLPRHLDRRQPPACMAGDASIACLADGKRKVLLCMACRARQARDADTGLPAKCYRPVGMLVVILGRVIAGGMAIHAARAGDHFRRFGEQGGRRYRKMTSAAADRLAPGQMPKPTRRSP